jgi:flagellar basal body rod protein FlgC/predicted double-glycine peptidase
MRHFAVVITLFLLGLGSQFLLGKEETIRVCGDLGEITRTVFFHNGLSYHKETGKTVIEVSDREEALSAVLKSLHVCSEKRGLVEQNIANVRTTKTVDGTPYRRRMLRIGDGSSLIVTQDQSDFNWAYDPVHPDAMKEGPKSGYVAYPNINLKQEEAELVAIETELQTLRHLINRLDPELIVPEHPTFSSFGPLREERLPVSTPTPSFELSNSVPLDIAGREPILTECKTTTPQRVRPLAQSNSVSCGQTSVAMCLNALMGSELTDMSIDAEYGFQLLEALRTESRLAGYTWYDAGNVGEATRADIESTLDSGLPVIVALNGPQFSPSGRGTIVTLTSYSGDRFYYADPADGEFRTTNWPSLASAPSHPDGNFVFLPSETINIPTADWSELVITLNGNAL